MHNANLYEYANMLQKRDTANVLREFAPKLKWNTQELILDIGCGSGDVTSGLLVPAIPKNMTKNFNVVGVDVSNDMVDHAKDKYGERNVSFCQMDISHEIPQRKMTRRFSKIFSFYCLHWVKDQGIALHNIHRLLEYNGEAVLVFLAKNPLFQVYRKMARKTEWASYMTDVEKFVPCHQDHTDPATSFSMELDTIEFQVISCEARTMKFQFSNANQLVTALKAVNPFLSRIPAELHGKFMIDILQELKNLRTPGMEHQGQPEANYTLMGAHFKKPQISLPEMQ